MTQKLVVDASVAIKWLVDEEESSIASRLKDRFRIMAPQLIYAECANILWKKVRRKHLSSDQAMVAAGLLYEMEVEIASMRELVEPATALSLRLDHPAYDCMYLTLAIFEDCPFVTADASLLRKMEQRMEGRDRDRCVMLNAFPV